MDVIYLAGPVANISDYLSRFDAAAELAALEWPCARIINPGRIFERIIDDDEIMDACLQLVDVANILLLLPGWEHSYGVRRELQRYMQNGGVDLYIAGGDGIVKADCEEVVVMMRTAACAVMRTAAKASFKSALTDDLG